ncbi:MAG: hypothetical protein ACSHWY_00010 [Octadecabacter sp.]
MKKFVLGVGAQKSGTTWLYTQFAAQDNFRSPHDKEMHIFDSIYLYNELPFGPSLAKRTADTIQKAPNNFRDFFIMKRFQMFLEPDLYFKYFDELMEQDGLFTCDITPSYSALPVEALEVIRDKFEERGIQTVPVFLMREPVSRLESAIKMNLRTSGALEDTTTEDMMERLTRQAGSPADKYRSAYRETVTRLNSVFGEDQVFLGFYETLFTEAEQTRVAQAFGLDLAKVDTKTKVNHTSTSFSYPEEFIQSLKAHYKDEYDFAINDLGLDAAVWDKSIAKLSR